MKSCKWTAVIFAALIFCSCSSVSKKQSSPLAVPFSPPSPKMRHSKACAFWKSGINDPRTPIRELARIRVIETCSSKAVSPSDAEIDAMSAPGAIEPWLRELLVRAALARAKARADKQHILKFSLEVTNYETNQTEQIRLLKQARSLAIELKDQKLQNQADELLTTLAPRLIDDPQPGQYLLVAADFRQARAFGQARKFYRKALQTDQTSDLEKLRAHDGIRMTYKLEKNVPRYLAETKIYADFAREKFLAKEPARYADARVAQARAVWTAGAPVDAEKILIALEKELKGKTPLYESIYVRSKIEEEFGHIEKSVKIFQDMDLSTVHDRAFRLKILWSEAWNLRKLNRLKEAAVVFKRMLGDEDNPPLIARDRFWLGKTLQTTDDFEWLIANDPIGYYGALAYRELKRPLPPLSASQEVGEASLKPDERNVFNWLLAANETDLARGLLDDLTAKRHWTVGTNLPLMKLYARTGNYRALFGQLKDMPVDIKKQILNRQASLLFPQPWNHLVKAAARRFSVKTELIYSIMRQESSFNPRSRSVADAFGLMQLIPEMADRAAQGSQDLEIASHDELYKPEFAVPLGAAYLHQLLNRWHGKFIPTVASYNAGEKSVSGWLKTRDRHDALSFIEDIPYEETRTYVKLVMRNFVLYSRLNSGNQPIPFPRQCLEGLQEINP